MREQNTDRGLSESGLVDQPATKPPQDGPAPAETVDRSQQTALDELQQKVLVFLPRLTRRAHPPTTCSPPPQTIPGQLQPANVYEVVSYSLQICVHSTYTI